MSTMTLEPCPFCGKSGPFDHWPCRWLDATGANIVRCPYCSGAAPLATWNRRAHLAQPAQAVDVGAIRDVIEQMRKASMQRAMPPHYQGGCYTAWIDALTSALTGQKAPPVRLRYGLASLSGEILAALRSHGNHDSLIADIQAVLEAPLPGLDALQRYYPSLPPKTHPGWVMTQGSTGEWVLFSDVANMLARNGYAVADVALNMLVAAGFVSQEKAQEAVSIARETALRDGSTENGARVFSYKNQPGNLAASRIGGACHNAKPGGDSIDHGLSLLKELQERGFGIVSLDPSSPDGMSRAEAKEGETCQMPKKLTAENGAKAALMGEFNIHRRASRSDVSAGIFEGAEEYLESIPVDWTTIKAIYAAAVKHFHPELK